MTTEFFSEKTVVNLVAEKPNKDAQLVLDPTLLLSKEDYMQLFECKNLPDKKAYVPTYLIIVIGKAK